ncbi:MAG: hypothetical protein HFG80_06010 [Eubacterium sp.]|nr:hypothetical protein [Eubacterium sp.]
MIFDHKNIKRGYEWLKKHYPEIMRDVLPPDELFHHGIKGQKWGVRHGPPYPLNRVKVNVEKTEKSGIVKKTISGHSGNPKKGISNSVSDHLDRNGKVDKRAFYDEDGWKAVEIHTTDHGNFKEHPYGDHGEHIHFYEWDHETGKKTGDRKDEISARLRKENCDIL